jgi:pimeloyl-ACP methyl ester carboxylesterase
MRRRSRSHSVLGVLGIMLALVGALTLGVTGIRLRAGPAFAQEQSVTDTIIAPAPVNAVAPPRVHRGMDRTMDQFTVHVPTGAPEPLRVLVALHGMGGTGEDFSAPLYALTDARGWAVVAPTFSYGDWRDPGQVTKDETRNLPQLATFLDRLPEIAGMDVNRAVYLYGFSRGGQTAERFALIYPERVAGVAMASSGTYTLPVRSFGLENRAALFPYGVADCAELFGRGFDAERFAQVPFWVGIGRRDSDPADVPHQWDQYLGDDRLERAGRIALALRSAGVTVEVAEFPDTGHAETDAVRGSAVEFLAAVPQPPR